MSRFVVAPAPKPLVPVVGTSERWAMDGALLFGLTPLVSASVVLFSIFGAGVPSLAMLVPWLTVSAALALTGGVLGAAAPVVMEPLRGRVPLSLLNVLMALLATAATMVVAGSVGAALGENPMNAVFYAVLIGGMTLVGWLPYTMAVVTRVPTWRVILPLLAFGPVWFWCMTYGRLWLFS